MLDVNQFKERPQDFELVELLFRPITTILQNQPGTSHGFSVQSQEPFGSFKARFQSFIDQIPSYLHSSEKEGFFPHLFLGIFSTLLDTKLSGKLEIENIHFRFDGPNTLKVVAKTKHKTHVFIFTEDSEEKHPDSGQTVTNKFEFTKGELGALGVNYNKSDKRKFDFKLIKINKHTTEDKKNITVQVKDKNIYNSDVEHPTKFPFKEITKYLPIGRYLEDHVVNLSSPQEDQVNTNFKKFLTDTQRIHRDLNLQNGVYGERAREANQHGFLAGVLDNFRYRYNAKIYLEQFAGRGYADIILLVRGGGPEPQYPYRIVNAVPIVIELKAGKDEKNITTGRKRKAHKMKVVPGITPTDAFNQAKGYVEGFQPNKLRILTLAKYVICTGINLDQGPPTRPIAFSRKANTSVEINTFKTEAVLIESSPRPLIENFLELFKRFCDKSINERNLKSRIKISFSTEYYTFPPTPEKSNDFYFSRFLLGQVIPMDNNDFERHVFIHDKITLIDKTMSSLRRSQRSSANKAKQAITECLEKLGTDEKEHDITTIIFIPKKQQHAILLNIIENSEGNFPKIKLDRVVNQLVNKKIIELNVWFNTEKDSNNKRKEFEDYLTMEDVREYNSSQDYSNSVNHNHVYDGTFEMVSCPVFFEKTFNLAIDSQKNHLNDQPVFSSQAYKNLFEKIGQGIFPFKNLIKGETSSTEYDKEEPEIGGHGKKYEALIQAVLHGLFNHYSDSKLIKYPENIELIATEFQTGAGSRIDMMIQGIGNSPQGIKEYMPVGIELKWGFLNEPQKIELINQMKRYAEGAAIKAITDSSKVVIMGVDFNDQATTLTALFVILEPTSSLVNHSSIQIFPVINIERLTQQVVSTSEPLVSSAPIGNITLPPRQSRPDLGPPSP